MEKGLNFYRSRSNFYHSRSNFNRSRQSVVDSNKKNATLRNDVY